MNNLLLRRIEDRTLVCGVVGLGYVGLPLAVTMSEAGYRTIGFDLQQSKVDRVNAADNYVTDVKNEDLREVVSKGIFSATSDFSQLADVDFVAICVPTPLDAYQQPDISFVKSSSETITKYIHKGMIVVLESTTYPGTTEELIKPILESSGLECAKDFYLGFSPERVDPGNVNFKTSSTPKVVGAISKDALDVIVALYSSFITAGVYPVSSPAVAEMTKILENTYRNINIGLVNELTKLCHHMNINLWEVIDAAKTKPFGFQPFYPGPGLGGHCIPLDPYYLSWKAREYGFHTSMIESSMMINDTMPDYCCERVGMLLNNQSKAIKGAKILQLGLAYKNDIDDYRESPALKVADGLLKLGADLKCYDPYVPIARCHNGLVLNSIPELTPEIIAESDIVVITTGHTCIDYNMIQRNARQIFDTRNAMASIKERSNISVL